MFGTIGSGWRVLRVSETAAVEGCHKSVGEAGCSSSGDWPHLAPED